MTLKDKVISNLDVVNPKEFSDKRISNLLISIRNSYTDEKFILILTLCYQLCNINDKIRRQLCNTNISYLSYDDYFQVFITTVWEKIYDYQIGVGTFIGHVNRWCSYAFADMTKSSFFHVTGNIEKEKRKDIKLCTINPFKNAIGYHANLDKDLLNHEIMEQIQNLPKGFRELILYKYFSSEITKSDEACAKYFGTSKGRIKYMRQTAFNLLWANGIVDLYAYQLSMEEDQSIEFYSVDFDTYFQTTGGLDTSYYALNGFKSHYAS